MKTKKALAVLLAVVMLVMPLAVSSLAAGTILTDPIKTVYNDSEYFNPQGLVILVDGEAVSYSPNDTKFRFDPALNELLTVDNTEVKVYYNNQVVASVPITVEHILGKLTAIDKGHGRYCLGCGELHEFEDHTIEEWIPNDDGGLFIQQTQTGRCTICDAEVTESIPNSEKFLHVFGEMTELEASIALYFYNIVVSLVQMLAGIY